MEEKLHPAIEAVENIFNKTKGIKEFIIGKTDMAGSNSNAYRNAGYVYENFYNAPVENLDSILTLFKEKYGNNNTLKIKNDENLQHEKATNLFVAYKNVVEDINDLI